MDKTDTNWGLIAKYLAGEASDAESAKVNEWLYENKLNKTELEKASASLDLLNAYSKISKINIENAWQKVSEKTGTNLQVRRNYQFLFGSFPKIAATIAILALLSISLYLVVPEMFQKEKMIALQSVAEEKYTIVNLPDGSIAYLNKNSKIEYGNNYNKKTRDIILYGEAFFEVAKNSKKRFSVFAGDIEVRVTGTSFNVKAYDLSDQIEVIVESGRVEMIAGKDQTKKVTLEKGNKGAFIPDSETLNRFETADLNELAWKTGRLNFNNNELQAVISAIYNTYHVEIILDNEALYNCRFTGTFTNEPVDSVVEVLKTAFNLSTQTTGNKILMKGKGCNE